MNIRQVTIAAVGAALMAGAAMAQGPAAAVYTPTSLKAEPGTPRGADGKPDLQGTWGSPYLGGLTGIPFVTPSTLVITDAQSKASQQTLIRGMSAIPGLELDPEIIDLMTSLQGFPIVRGQRRSRLLVMPADGRLPLTPAATAEINRNLAQLMASPTGGKADNPEDRFPTERCLAQGGAAPFQIPVGFSPLQLVQTRGHFVIHSEIGNDVRIAPFTAAHGDARLAPPLGDSIARWEGDTLVVETTHSPAVQRLRVTPLGGLIVNPDARVIERFTRVSRDEILYQFTIEDPKVFSGPWLGEFSLYRMDDNVQPSGCHEANYGLANILSGARYEERFPPAKPVNWADAVKDDAGQRTWTRAMTNATEIRAWTVLTPKDGKGEASVALRIERSVGPTNNLSETNSFTVDCAGQRLQQTAVVTYAGRNLTGDKTEAPGVGGWQPATLRPNLAAAVAKACG